jgi:uncharacterized membrane protein
MITYLFLFLSALGFLDSAFLTLQHYTKDPFNCPLFGGCEQVTGSIYSEVFGIPIALLGAAYYLLIFLIALFHYLTNNKKALHIVSHLNLTFFGFATSLYLIFIMVFVLQAICFYCLVSAISSISLFTLGFFTLKRDSAFFKLI